MLTRRTFLQLTGGTCSSLLLGGCVASSLPLRSADFPPLSEPHQPFAGLAVSLPEEHDYQAAVEGKIPRELRGTLYRNGPGLFDRGGLRKRALFDGDGMVQAFRIHDQGVRYQNRFVRTRKYLDESAAGRFIYPSWSTQAPGGFWANFWAADNVLSQAGVTVMLFNGRLYAFDEGSLPYALDPATLETAGVSNLGLPQGTAVFSAHSKLDPLTGEWLLFGLEFGPTFWLHVTILDRQGGLRLHRRIEMPRNVFIHDFIATDRHLIFVLHPAEIGFLSFLLGRQSIVDSMSWRPAEGNLVLVLEREGTAEPVRLTTEACFMWHSLNAHESSGELVADFVGYANPDHLIGADPPVIAVMTGRRGINKYPGELRRYLIDLRSKTIRQEILDRSNYEWPRINERHRGYRYRYGYLAKCRPGEFFWSIVTRVDMQGGKVESYGFGPGIYCSEAVFVPLPAYHYLPDSLEEPGWLLTECYNDRTKRGFLAILRAERLADGPVALVHLSHHVPFSFHGFWQEGG